MSAREPEFPWRMFGVLLLLAALWLVIGRPLVLNAQPSSSDVIFADGFETGDASCWPNGCGPDPDPEPPATLRGPCDEGEVIEKMSEPYRCEPVDTPHGTAWRYFFGVVCSDGAVRVGLHEYGSEKPRNCEEEG